MGVEFWLKPHPFLETGSVETTQQLLVNPLEIFQGSLGQRGGGSHGHKIQGFIGDHHIVDRNRFAFWGDLPGSHRGHQGGREQDSRGEANHGNMIGEGRWIKVGAGPSFFPPWPPSSLSIMFGFAIDHPSMFRLTLHAVLSFTTLSVALALFTLGCGRPQPSGSTVSKPTEDAKVAIEPGEADPSASPQAVPGGSLTTWAGGFPKSLNMWLDYNSFSAQVTGLMYEPLVELHSTRNEPVGHLASEWHQSEDGLTFTFKIHPKATWSDGKAITAHDVVFYYDTMMDPKNLTSIFRVDLQKIEKPVAMDEKTLKVVAKGQHWNNFWMAAGLFALPRHTMEG